MPTSPPEAPEHAPSLRLSLNGPSIDTQEQSGELPSHPSDCGTPLAPSLDPLELESTTSPDHVEPEQLQELAITFRHSSWLKQRAHLLTYLERTAPATAIRVKACGSSAWIMRRETDNGPTYRLAANLCHHRWCVPCRTELRKRVTFRIQDHLRDLKESHLRLLTLTLCTSDDPLPDQIARLYDSFSKLRTRAKIKPLITGGIALLEITYNFQTNRWHPHLHCLITGQYLPQKLLSQQWHQITGDSFIVDVRLVRTKAALGYVAKYLGKTVPHSVERQAPLFEEVAAALHGRRTCFTFGSFRGWRLTDTDPPAEDWEAVGTLAEFIDRAQHGDSTALQVLSILRRQSHEPFNHDARSPPPPFVSSLPQTDELRIRNDG